MTNSTTPPATTSRSSRVAIIGGGPAGLMAAEIIAAAGIAVDIYDAMPSVGRKFLLAGVGGMNITHAETFKDFVGRYGEAASWLKTYLDQFDADALRAWVHGLGIDTFVGTSGRVFPKDMKAAPLLRAWLHRLRSLGVSIHPRHRWLGWSNEGELIIEQRTGESGARLLIKPAACLLALGGGSWQRLGSDGAWVPLLRAKNIAVHELAPSNCGFETPWSQKLRDEFAGQPLHTLGVNTKDPHGNVIALRGEAILSSYGIEGSVIYALSSPLRKQLEKTGKAELWLDLLPDHSLEWVVKQLQKPRGKNSISNFLRKQLNLPPVKMALLRELTDKTIFEQPLELARALKNLRLVLVGTRPIDEAISCAGGVAAPSLTPELMLKNFAGVFCAGEMLDWEAPTGGYLLTACFATGRAAGLGIVNYVRAVHE